MSPPNKNDRPTALAVNKNVTSNRTTDISMVTSANLMTTVQGFPGKKFTQALVSRNGVYAAG